jgi:hypothetical protein
MCNTITMVKKIELPEAFKAFMTKNKDLVIITTVFNPADSRMYLTLENISVTGALMLTEIGTTAQLVTTQEHIKIAAGE